MFKVIEEKIAVPLMIILTLFVLGGIYYSVNLADKEFEKATEYAPIKIEKKDPTENWQTYRNEEFGFEFKYPAEYEYVSYEYNDSFFECLAKKEDASDFEGVPACVFSINVYAKQYNSLKDEANASLGSLSKFLEMDDPSVEINWFYAETNESPGGNAAFYTYTKDGNSVVEINFGVLPKDSDSEIIQTLLSTFKFIEPCGELPSFEEHEWYSAFVSKIQEMDYYSENDADRTVKSNENNQFFQKSKEEIIAGGGKLSEEKISEACLVDKFLLAIAPGEYGGNGFKLIRFNTENLSTNVAERESQDWFVAPDAFKEVKEDTIILEGRSGDAGCEAWSIFEYNIVDNYIDLIEKCSFCEGEKEVSCTVDE